MLRGGGWLDVLLVFSSCRAGGIATIKPGHTHLENRRQRLLKELLTYPFHPAAPDIGTF